MHRITKNDYLIKLGGKSWCFTPKNKITMGDVRTVQCTQTLNFSLKKHVDKRLDLVFFMSREISIFVIETPMLYFVLEDTCTYFAPLCCRLEHMKMAGDIESQQSGHLDHYCPKHLHLQI